tara:strand:+ start:399 stop:650 length:252 start_codon:yes stop_codon:yes gene_type:complete
MASRYAPPREAMSSEEKKRKEEGQNYSKRPLPRPKIYREPLTLTTRSVVKDGYTYENYHSNAPLSDKEFNRLTKNKYKKPRGA